MTKDDIKLRKKIRESEIEILMQKEFNNKFKQACLDMQERSDILQK